MLISIKHKYKVECFSPDGRLKWKEDFENIVVTTGLNTYLDYTLKTGSGGTPSWYVFLKGSGTVVASDTMASHPGWSEVTPYSNATRPQWIPGTISNGSVSNSASKAVFDINATSSIYGCGMTNNSVKGGTSGTLLGAGDFAAARNVQSGDTLNVEVTCSMTSS